MVLREKCKISPSYKLLHFIIYFTVDQHVNIFQTQILFLKHPNISFQHIFRQIPPLKSFQLKDNIFRKSIANNFCRNPSYNSIRWNILHYNCSSTNDGTISFTSPLMSTCEPIHTSLPITTIFFSNGLSPTLVFVHITWQPLHF